MTSPAEQPRQQSVKSTPRSRRGAAIDTLLNVIFSIFVLFVYFHLDHEHRGLLLPAAWVIILVLQPLAKFIVRGFAERVTASLSEAARNRILFIAAIPYWTFTAGFVILLGLALQNGKPLFIFEGGILLVLRSAVQLFVIDLLRIEPESEANDFEHSPPLTELPPIQSATWGASPQGRQLL